MDMNSRIILPKVYKVCEYERVRNFSHFRNLEEQANIVLADLKRNKYIFKKSLKLMSGVNVHSLFPRINRNPLKSLKLSICWNVNADILKSLMQRHMNP